MCLRLPTVMCFAHCTVQFSSHCIFLHLMQKACSDQLSDCSKFWCSKMGFLPQCWLIVLFSHSPLLSSRASSLCLCLSSLEPHLYPPLRVCFALDLCVCCVCVLRVQLPTGPLIFNPLQQSQLSQFSPQQSQSATSSPQQQGETVRHNFTHCTKGIYRSLATF